MRKPVSTRKLSSGAEGFLPDFCSLRPVFVVVVTAELFAIILALSAGPLDDFWVTLSQRSLMVQWIALGTALLLCLLRPVLARQDTARAGILAWALLLGVALAVTEAAVYGWPAGVLDLSAPGRAHWALLAQSLGISAIAGGLVLRYLYVQSQWRRQIEAESRARFQALQSRIRPHFLFNSMNTIAALARTDPAMAEEAVGDLSDLLRASLRETGRLSTLGEELELARGYLRIEQLRLGERLTVEWDLEALPEEAPLPSLVIQPLIENAVYHGVERLSSPARITVSGRHRRGRVNLSIRNPVPAAPAASAGPRREGHRLAVDNIRERLAGCFGDAAGLTSSEIDGEYQVRLVFPYPWIHGQRPAP